MKRGIAGALALVLLLSACGCWNPAPVEMTSSVQGGLRLVHWDGRTYAPFCVVPKNSRGGEIGYVDGDRDDRISAYEDWPPEEWLVSWMPQDGGALLLKEEHVTEIPDGLEREYP